MPRRTYNRRKGRQRPCRDLDFDWLWLRYELQRRHDRPTERNDP